MQPIAGLILGERIFKEVGKKQKLSAASVRVLGAIHVLNAGGTLANYASIGMVLTRQGFRTTWNSVQELIGAGLVSKYSVGRQTIRTRLSFKLEARGALLVDEIERQAKTAAEQAGKIVGAKEKKKRVRKVKASASQV